MTVYKFHYIDYLERLLIEKVLKRMIKIGVAPGSETLAFRKEFVRWLHTRDHFKLEKNAYEECLMKNSLNDTFSFYVNYDEKKIDEGGYGYIYKGKLIVPLSDTHDDFFSAIKDDFPKLLPEKINDNFIMKVVVKKPSHGNFTRLTKRAKEFYNEAKSEIENEWRMLSKIHEMCLCHDKDYIVYPEANNDGRAILSGVNFYVLSHVDNMVERNLVYPYLAGDTLYTRLTKPNALTKNTPPDLRLRYWLLPLMETIIGLHRFCGLAHGDLKPNNICFKENTIYSRPILIDFARCRPLDKKDNWTNNPMRDEFSYYAPETFPSGEQDDIYGINVLTLEILLGRECLRVKSFRDAFHAVEDKMKAVKKNNASTEGEKHMHMFIITVLTTIRLSMSGEIDLFETYKRHKSAIVFLHTFYARQAWKNMLDAGKPDDECEDECKDECKDECEDMKKDKTNTNNGWGDVFKI